jgi:Uma2 family endonuclease
MAVTEALPAGVAGTDPIPPLENGDRLSLAEFERRYAAMPHVKKAELIEGRVYMASPVSYRGHSQPHSMVMAWLGQYWAATPGVEAGDNGTIRLDAETMPQPDAFLMLLPERGGQARVGEDDFIEGAPELIIEVAATSASYDLHEKLRAYERGGVREYLVWRVLEGAVDWLVLREGRFEPLPPAPDGILRSEVFPGLRLDVEALLRGNLARVAAVLREGLESPEHAAFAGGSPKA